MKNFRLLIRPHIENCIAHRHYHCYLNLIIDGIGSVVCQRRFSSKSYLALCGRCLICLASRQMSCFISIICHISLSNLFFICFRSRFDLIVFLNGSVIKIIVIRIILRYCFLFLLFWHLNTSMSVVGSSHVFH